MAETFNTNLALGQDGNTAPADVDEFRSILLSISAGAVDIGPLANSSTAIADVKLGSGGGGINVAITSPTQVMAAGGRQADELLFTHEFGLEMAEFLSWYYKHGGDAAFQGILDGVPEGVIFFPLILRASESGGWFREAMTLKKWLDGRYSDGSQIKYRAFGIHADAIQAAFPNIDVVETSAGLTDVQGFYNGNFNAGEFNEPVGDASPTTPASGLFPNWPAKTGSVVEALGGRPHYYIGGYHTPFRCRCLLANSAWYNGTLTAVQRDMFQAAVKSQIVSNMAQAMKGSDAIIKAWQDMGVVIHRAQPRDVLDRLRTALEDAQDAAAAADANYALLLTSQRTFMRENGVKWGSLPDRRYRIARTAYETLLKTNG